MFRRRALGPTEYLAMVANVTSDSSGTRFFDGSRKASERDRYHQPAGDPDVRKPAASPPKTIGRDPGARASTATKRAITGERHGRELKALPQLNQGANRLADRRADRRAARRAARRADRRADGGERDQLRIARLSGAPGCRGRRRAVDGDLVGQRAFPALPPTRR